ncbi:MAG: aspartate aminotransferase family protein [Pseudomonadota bacterium]
MSDAYLMPVYGRMPVGFVRGSGAWLIDEEGRRYFDAITGIGVCSLGHAHPDVAAAVADQVATLVHTSNVPRIPLQEKLAERLCQLSGMDRAFFCNSGAEAVECALKLARLNGYRKGQEAMEIIVAEGSFHGRTMATISATDNTKAQEGFAPILKGFRPVPFGDIAAIRQAVADHPQIGAVLLETVQGEGGIHVPPPGFLRELREFCTEQGLLLIADEVQSGIGKTGHWFAYQHDDVLPDIVACAKALGNGIPIGACLAREQVAAAFQPGNHGSTFGGNPLACRAALAVLEVMERDRIPERATELGEWFREHLRSRLGNHPAVVEVRGRGLMVGIELAADCPEIKAHALQRGVVTNVTRGRVIRLLPPLISTREELEMLTDVLCESIELWHGDRAA